ncbi:MAG TPA: HAD-IIA family hydrolase [Acidimicrobiales bacterium]|jgi:HAD superfamily hydrolase (TIGR01450 family)|nr:HAD-IIA family hydrolase [Acidimicrobiales bacterium]
MTWLLDLDGVVWLAEDAIPGSAEAIAHLRGRGERVVFLTNNSSATIDDYLAKLDRVGIPTAAGDLITSAQAAASLVEPGETALVCAGPGVEQALQARGARTVRRGRADAVVVGWHRDFDFDRLTAAFDAVIAGARLIGTNDDATYPTPAGPLPGGGSILAAVSYATGVEPVVAGKPFGPVVELLQDRVPDPEIMVGDRPTTDGLLAHRIGVPFALVLSGVTSAGSVPTEPPTAYVARDLADLVDQRYGRS